MSVIQKEDRSLQRGSLVTTMLARSTKTQGFAEERRGEKMYNRARKKSPLDRCRSNPRVPGLVFHGAPSGDKFFGLLQALEATRRQVRGEC